MIVYCYTNKLNGKKYIGITSRSLDEREKSHLYEAYNKNLSTYNVPFKRAIRKYGIDNFDKAILYVCDSFDEACEKEKFYIEKYKTYYKYKNSNGYNATIGGDYISCPKDKVYQIDIDKYKKHCKNFNYKYEQDTPFVIHDVSMLVPVIKKKLGHKYDNVQIAKFVIAFIKYMNKLTV